MTVEDAEGAVDDSDDEIQFLFHIDDDDDDDDVDEEAFDDDVTEYCRIEEDPPDGDSSRSGSLLKFPSFFPTFIAECNTCSDEGSGTLEYEVEIGLSSFFLA